MGFWNRLLRRQAGSPTRDPSRDTHDHPSRNLGSLFHSSKNASPRFPDSPISGIDHTQNFPPDLLDRIFRYVCPHTLDESYASNENAPLEDRCFLCDTRNLAQCARVKSSWRDVAYRLL